MSANAPIQELVHELRQLEGPWRRRASSEARSELRRRRALPGTGALPTFAHELLNRDTQSLSENSRGARTALSTPAADELAVRLRASALLAVGGLATLAASGCGGEPARVRVVVVTLDTLRHDGLRQPGPVPLMPETLAFAEGGQVFESAWSTTSTTQPTHASLFTGLYPWAHGVVENGLVLGDEHVTVAELFRAAGYGTHAVVASAPLQADFGYDQGFDTFHDEFDVPYVREWEGRAIEGRFYSLGESVTDHALAALDAAEGERQFFWFHYFDPHDPYGNTGGAEAQARGEVMPIQALLGRCGTPGLEAELERARRLYEADVRALDEALGRLLARLERDAAEYETHVVLTSDHGESFGELGALGHGKRVTREQVWVPLVLRSPRLAPARRADPASSVDVLPTLLALGGVAPPGGVELPGRDLTRSDAADHPVFGMRRVFREPKTELTTDGREHPLPVTWFYSVRGGRLLAGNGELVLEEDDRARELAGTEADALRARFAQFEEILSRGGRAETTSSPEALDALRALGYIGEEAAH